MNEIAAHLAEVRARIQEAETASGRSPGSVKLVAISKGHDACAIAAAFHAGQIQFGENYLQEALVKMDILKSENIEWHYTGAIQSNKTQLIAEHFSWVQSVDRLRIAQRLDDQRPRHLPPLNICIQVNIGNEPQKAGVVVAEVDNLAKAIVDCPRLALRGIMAIPPPMRDTAEQREYFLTLRMIFEKLVAGGLTLDTLSMGMSSDFEVAIAEGATMVRVGTAIFGSRRRNA